MNHININVPDLDAAVAFYATVLGMEVTRHIELEGDWLDGFMDETSTGVTGRVAWGRLPQADVDVELVEWTNPRFPADAGRPQPRRGGLELHGLRVDDLGTARSGLERHGIAIDRGPVSTPNGIRIVFFHDPAGTRLHFTELPARHPKSPRER